MSTLTMQWLHYRREVADPGFDHEDAANRLRETVLDRLTPDDHREKTTTYRFVVTDDQGRDEEHDPALPLVLPDWAVGLRIVALVEFEPIPPVTAPVIAPEVPGGQ